MVVVWWTGKGIWSQIDLGVHLSFMVIFSHQHFDTGGSNYLGYLDTLFCKLKCSHFVFKRWRVLQGPVHFSLYILSFIFKSETPFLLMSIICLVLWLKYSDTSHSEWREFLPISPQLRNFSGNSSSLKRPRDNIINGNITMSSSQGLFLEVPWRQVSLELREASCGEAGTRNCIFEFQTMEFVS